MKLEEMALIEDTVKALESMDKRLEAIEKRLEVLDSVNKAIDSINKAIDDINEDIYIDVKGFMNECNIKLAEIKKKVNASGLLGNEENKPIKLVSARDLLAEDTTK